MQVTTAGKNLEIKIRGKHNKLMKYLVLTFVAFKCINGYCWNQNPGWSGPPKVTQRAMDTVQVSWKDLVTQRDCTNNFVVKYWLKSVPANYQVTDFVEPAINFIDIKVTPKIEYEFQAVARESKGKLRGVEWHKSPIVKFKTSSTFVPQINYFYDEMSTMGPVAAPGKKSGSTLIMGLSIEVFVVICVAILILCITAIGLIYKLKCRSQSLEFEDDDERNELSTV